VGCDVGVTKEEGLISGSERQVNKETERSDIGGTRGKGLVCGIEKLDDRMTERCGGLQSEVRTERDIFN
jgi:4-aminobutyrate aminotransferase-like enzyme